MRTLLAATLALAACCAPLLALAGEAAPSKATIDRGRYLVKITGCNDCHTAGYAPTAGKVPESEWLTGDVLGFRGPWGTTYPSNLRQFMAKLSIDQWLAFAKKGETRPPMPWFNLRDMSDADLRAMYAYVRSLPVAGKPAPAYLPPDQQPAGPYIQWPAPPK
jgi:mono/diheme cytochrome c family protein